MSRTVLPVGDRGLLVECADGREARALCHALDHARPEGVVEVVPGAETVLVRVAGVVPAALVDLLAELPVEDVRDAVASRVVLDTVYDGADLAGVARLLGLSTEGLVELHADRTWTVAFLGFAPGFAYLEPDRPLPEVPRRTDPRTAVEPGSVAVAGRWSAVYPRRSPGGWQLLGRTGAVLWDAERDPPATLVPGAEVRFRPVRETVRAAATRAPEPSSGALPEVALEVVEAIGTLVEDLGRPGLQALGVPRSGAADRASARRANRLVGNPPGSAVLETLGGLEVRAVGHDLVLAVAPAASVTVDGVPVPSGRPFRLPVGAGARIGAGPHLRAYLAVRGGVDLPPVLGSRSTDVLSGIGPTPPQAGDLLPVGPDPGTAVTEEPEPALDDEEAVRLLHVVTGPRADRLVADAAALLTTTWSVGTDSNRVGVRLVGPALERVASREPASEGMVPGAVQVPPSGRPVVLLSDHPTTGGYPVAAVVVDADLDVVGRLRPGDRVRFVAVG